MKRILYSKSADARTAFVRRVFDQLDGAVDKIVYLAPKKFMGDIASRIPEATLHPYEDIVKSNDIFNTADDRTLLVFDRPSRYKSITSNVFIRLSRAAAKYVHRCVVDIVPFTAGVEYLYCPLAFVDRGILGYQHWYSFRENNMEMTDAGEQVRAHDYVLLAQKLKPHAAIDYDDFLSNQIQVIDCLLTPSEKAEYQALRDRLFAENRTASPIITTLADWTNIRESRYAKLRELLADLRGETVIYTNLAGHNRRLKKRFKGVAVKSFYDVNGEEDKYDYVLLFEVPIVKSYLFLDVIANIRPDCKVFIFRSDATVDKYLYKKMNDEYTGFNSS